MTVILAIAGGAVPSKDQDYFAAGAAYAGAVAGIPLVCFGIAFPAMVLFREWRYQRTGDSLFRTLARRWSKVILGLFVGAVTGTILSFELGLLWPALAGATFLIGSGMTVLAADGWVLALGILLLFACAISTFGVATAQPDPQTQTRMHGRRLAGYSWL